MGIKDSGNIGESRPFAMALAEGDIGDKTVDVGVIFNNREVDRHFVLRTCYLTYAAWKSTYGGSAAGSPFITSYAYGLEGAKKQDPESKGYAAWLGGELWVFGVDATSSRDIYKALDIAAEWFGVRPEFFLSDIYVKNLNVDTNKKETNETLVRRNKRLYAKTCEAIHRVSKIKSSSVNFWVFSHKENFKIKQKDLRSAMRAGGASIAFSSKEKHSVNSGSNNGEKEFEHRTNLHLAKINFNISPLKDLMSSRMPLEQYLGEAALL
ncbi:hypothetical protein ACJJIE_04530 [Microbulbifer sp. TRSA001]|uniref:hypothetical protein n=1 Tax=Microbulbifer sp. TRSA001 TaxID=3243381 RepID=UPI004039E116